MECAICLEEITDKYTTTSCGHNFHKKCLKKWFRVDKSYKIGGWVKCPLCRRPSFEEDDFKKKPKLVELVVGNLVRIINIKL